MNKRIVLSLIAATLLATGSAFAGVAFAGGNGTGHSMMGSSGMMYGPTQASQGGSSTGGTPINRNAPYMMRGMAWAPA